MIVETIAYTGSDGQGTRRRVRVEGAGTAVFTYEDGSTLTVEQDADGNRRCTVSPWPSERNGQ
ncbi:hypothetical protein [Nocardia carnea]|uniref:hypothetical protein n=1 Tax=Nocardia carnea TaxID=37328 RepID=UPI002453F355|nr:hypothetical protein [Nocardia carnea]